MHPSAQSAWQERPQNVLDARTCLCLRHVGDVTVVLSKKGRNVSPQHTKILVTNLAELTPSQVVYVSKTLGDRAAELGIEIGLGVGRTPGQRGHQPQ